MPSTLAISSVRRGPSRSMGTPSNGPSSAPGTDSTTNSSARSPGPTSNSERREAPDGDDRDPVARLADRLPGQEQREAPDPQHAHPCTLTVRVADAPFDRPVRSTVGLATSRWRRRARRRRSRARAWASRRAARPRPPTAGSWRCGPRPTSAPSGRPVGARARRGGGCTVAVSTRSGCAARDRRARPRPAPGGRRSRTPR